MPQEPEIIEAEIVENTEVPSAKPAALEPVSPVWHANEPPPWHNPTDHARPYGDHGGMLGGFWVLAIGFIVTAIVLLVSVCIVIPCTLLMRLLGIHKRRQI